MLKKYFIALLLLCLVVIEVPINPAFAAVDVTKPTLESVKTDKKEVKAGDTIHVQVKASDKESGVNSVYLYYKSPITGKYKYVRVNYNSSTGYYEGEITIDDSVEPGEWYVGYVTVSDNADNTTTIYGPIEGSNFIVKGTKADVTKPTLESIKVDKKEVKAGDTVHVQVKVSDKESGVNSVYLYYKSPITGKYKYTRVHYNSSTSYYEGEITIDNSVEPGEWYVGYVTVSDNADNTTTIYGPIEGSNFIVKGTKADVTKPTIESVKTDKKEVKAGDTIHVQVKASDKESGVNSVYLYYKSPITGKYKYIRVNYNSSTGYYEGEITIDDSVEPGEWYVGYVTVSDNVDNTTTIYGPIEGSSFIVKDYTQDNNKPTFNEIKVDNSKVEVDNYNRITVKATDDTLVKSVTVNYIKPNSKKTEAIVLDKGSDQETFFKEWYVSSNAEVGEWKVASIEIVDLNGNKTNVTTNIQDGNFTILKPIKPLDNYVVTSNEVWSNQVIDHDVYIGPNAILTINGNVRINGNIYVLGMLKGYGGLSVNGTIYAKNFTSGYSNSLYRGYVVLSGSNSISGLSISNQPLQDIPLTVYNTPLKAVNGKVDVEGVTVPVVDVYLNDRPLGLNSNGTFRLNGYNVENQKQLTFKFIDVFGNTTTKTYKVYGAVPVSKPTVNAVSDQDTTVTGTADVESVVTVKAGTSIYEATTDKNGQYSVLIKKQKAGTKLTITATDEVGNKSESISVNVLDKTKPQTPKVNAVTNEDTKVTGMVEAKNSVYVKLGSTIVGRATANSKGQFTATIPKQKAKTKLSILSKDGAGNYSPAVSITVGYVDRIAPPSPKVNPVSDQDQLVTGTAEKNATIEVKAGTKTYTTIVKADGTYSVSIDKQKAGSTLSITATDQAKNSSNPTTVIVQDKTKPKAPKVNAVTADDSKVTGIVEAKNAVYIKVGSTIIGRATANTKGTFTANIPKQKAKTKLVILSKDAAGNYSPSISILVGAADRIAPPAPKVNEVSDADQAVTGTAEKNVLVEVKINGKLYKTSAKSDGTYSVTIDKQKAGTVLSVTARDSSNNTSTPTSVTVQDKTAPLQATVNPVTTTDTKVTGKAEPKTLVFVKVGATIIGKNQADEKGSFAVVIPKQKAKTKVNVVLKDGAGNYSPYTHVVVAAGSTEQSLSPAVNQVTSRDTKVTGKTEPNALIYVKVGADIIGRGKASASGSFSVNIPSQKAGTKLSVTAKKTSGKYTPYAVLTVK
ncbi:Ig-like domain-containing protein [Priestia megaterium]|uniref:Ig-like domain-containing protein n=1 Tax=Priestia megaterium TaxID=1404 RepID=UPI00204139CC|nr:Ig-like domain-containing protein [Priestia megaterium]MCM3194133.1 Ig-like domain-containing protein [Priestia megaterium]